MNDELVKKRLINNTYKILVIYEKCENENENDFSSFYRTLSTTISILTGHLNISYDPLIYDGLCLLKSLEIMEELTQTEVKKIVMLCINRIKNAG